MNRKPQLIAIIFYASVLFLIFSCKKTSAPNAGNFGYTLIDTNDVSHSFSDYSNINGGLFYYNSSSGYGSYPAGYISNHDSTHYFIFYDYSSDAVNNIVFSVPSYNQTIQGTDSSSETSLVINYTASDGANMIKPVTFSITTNIKDTVSLTVSGSFTLTGTTASGKTISASGTFSNFGFF
ncbi:MAG TPA: hypothetical protein VMT76_05140 [Puia sp.]|nr:hypothetical protein [Puia sp.]